MNNHDGCRKSVTLRISVKLLNNLTLRAKYKKISLNALANQIFEDYDEWHSRAIDAGITTLSKVLLSQLVEELNEEQLRKIAERYTSSTAGKELVLSFAHSYDVHSVLHTLRMWVRNSGFNLIEQVENNTQQFIIQHEMGAKWSLLVSEIILGLLKPLTSRTIETEIAGSTIILTIE
jgi:hypothetical protein